MDRMGRVQASSSIVFMQKSYRSIRGVAGNNQQRVLLQVQDKVQESRSIWDTRIWGPACDGLAQLRIRDSAEPPANFSTSGSTNYGTPHPRKPLEQHITMSSNLILVGSFVVRAVSATVSLGTYLPASALACSERHCCHSRIGDRGALGGWRARARLCVSLSGIRHD